MRHNRSRSFIGSLAILGALGTVPAFAPAFSQAPKADDPPPRKPAKPQDSEVTKPEGAGAGKDVRKAAPTVPVPPAGRAAEGKPRTTPFTGNFLPFLRAELLLVRTICGLTEDERKAIGREGAQALRNASSKYVDWQRSEGRKSALHERSAPPDSRKQIQDGVSAAVKKHLTAEQQARYQAEIERRNTEERQTTVRYLVAILDRNLLLSADQRAQLSESLTSHWDHAWREPLEVIQNGNTLVPPVPDQYVIPFLDAVQTGTWRGIQKLQAGLRYSPFGWDMTLDNDPLEDVELDLAQHADLKTLRIMRADAGNEALALKRVVLAQRQAAQAAAMAEVQAALRAREAQLLARRPAVIKAREVEPVGGARPGDEPEEEKREVAPPRPVMMPRAQFDAFVFSSVGDAGAARRRFDSLLALRVGDVERAGGLTEHQKKKLLVAGRGDIKRFFDDVDAAYNRINLVEDNRARSREISRQVQPLQQTFIRSDLFDDGSIFAKALSKTLDEGQLARYHKALLERSVFRSRAAVRAVVGTLGNDLGLSTGQQQTLVTRILEESRPPTRFGRNDYWFVLHQAARLPEANLRPIFDKTQWQMLSSQLTRASGMGPWLKGNGYIFGDEPASQNPARSSHP
jgi:hypothetical protein